MSDVARSNAPVATRWEDYAPWEIAEHLLATHHAFAWSELARLGALVEQLGASAGDVSAAQDLAALFGSFRADLEAHLAREEAMLFPWIGGLRIAEAEGTSAERGPFATVQEPLAATRSEHDEALAVLSRMRQRIARRDAPDRASPAWTALDEGLLGLERDLRELFRLEDEILGPMLVTFERALVA